MELLGNVDGRKQGELCSNSPSHETENLREQGNASSKSESLDKRSSSSESESREEHSGHSNRERKEPGRIERSNFYKDRKRRGVEEFHDERKMRATRAPESNKVEPQGNDRNSLAEEIKSSDKQEERGLAETQKETEERGLGNGAPSPDAELPSMAEVRSLMESDDETHSPVALDDDSFGDSSDFSDGDQDDILPSDPKVFHLPALTGCRSVEEYARLNKIDEGTFGVVFRARDKVTGEIVALKRIKVERNQPDFPITSLREINILMSISHPNVVALKEIVTERREDSVYMVMEYMDHDLKMLMRSLPQPFRQADVKCLLKQLLEGVAAMHELWILHRDLKTSNLLLNNKGILKICDFGLARKYGSPIGRYSKNVVTLYYRAPELLLGSDIYTNAVDMWSVGCIFAEFLTKEYLFPGNTEFEQIDLIFKLLGTPKVEEWPEYVDLPHVKSFRFKPQPSNNLRSLFPRDSLIGGVYLSDAGFDLLSSMLCYNPAKRISAQEALKHPYFTERPFPQDPCMMPTFPSLNEGGVNAALRHKLKTSTSSMNDVKHQRALQETQSEGFFLG